jgi:sodium-dependent dicarboxylate transporter 2/3/5
MNNDLAIDTGTKPRRSVLKFVISLVVAIAMVFVLKEPQFTDSQLYVIFLLFFAIGLWITEAIPAFAVSLFIIAFLVFAMGNPFFNSAPENIEQYVTTFSSSVIWLMLGGFFIALAMKKTKLDELFFQFAVRISGKNPRSLLFGLMITTMITSMLMSSAAATAMVVASITPLITSLGKNSGVTKALLLGVPLAAIVGGMGTIIGTPANAIAVGQLTNNGMGISFLEWTMFAIPIAIVLTVISGFVLIMLFLRDNTPIDPDLIESKRVAQTREIKVQRRIVITILIVTILLWLAGSYLDITVASVTAVPLVFLTLTGIVSGEDVRGLPWDTLLLVAGGLSLGVALQHTHLLGHYSARMLGMGLHPIVILFILAYLTMLLANFMSASAIVTVFVPIAFVLLPALQKEAAIIIALATSAGMFLPVSDIPNSIVHATGYIEQKDFLKSGLVVGLLGPALIIVWILFVS